MVATVDLVDPVVVDIMVEETMGAEMVAVLRVVIQAKVEIKEATVAKEVEMVLMEA
jgi:hypothetical protein